MQTAHLQLDSSSCAIMFSSKRLELPSTNLRLSSSQRKSLRELYQKYNFKSKSINKIILTLFQYGEGDAEEDAQFENVLTAHVTRHLRDGMPSLHNDICALLRSHDKDSGNKYILDAYDVKRHPVFKLVLRLVDKFTDNLKKYSLFVEPTEGSAQFAYVIVLIQVGQKVHMRLYTLNLYMCRVYKCSTRTADCFALGAVLEVHTPRDLR